MDINSTFIKGKMNKSVDERLVPPGEYVDALNVRLGSTETTEIGAVENSKGNSQLTTLQINGVDISPQSVCIGSYADGITETIYWFVHDPASPVSGTGKADLVVSFNTSINSVTYHLISFDKLNFDPQYLITGVSKIEDLLFFTDDLNPPRFINVKRDYGTPNAFTEEQISVVVKPPGFRSYTNSLGVQENELAAPQINLFNSNQIEDTFLEDVFISFAYRFKYKDNQYSATSLFATAAFAPGNFQLNYSTFENEGMQNSFNSVEVKVSTGNAEVVAIDILYKQSNSTSIYVVEKLNKELLGLSNNSTFSYTINSQKIYTLLGSDELLRQYDNVPLIAKSLTIQGNRLIYGNYEDGRDITTENGTPIPVNFIAEPKSVDVSGFLLKTPEQTGSTVITNYNIQGALQSFTANDATFFIQNPDGTSAFPSGVPKGTVFTITYAFQFRNGNFGDTADPDFPTGFVPFNGDVFDVTIAFSTGQAYSSVNSMLQGSEFQNSIGTTNFQPIATAGSGASLTDRLNSLISGDTPTISGGFPANYTLDLSGITSNVVQEGIAVSLGSDNFTMTPIAFKYVSSTGVECYSYCRMVANQCLISAGTNIDKESLHSNRDYDVGIVYLDEYARATPVITSLNSSTHFPAYTSISKNTIQVEVSSQPPFWAKKYKFVLKPSATNYNIVYVTRFYKDRQDPEIYWLKLEGDDQNLVSAGQRLICKADSNGPLNQLAVETIIDVQAYGGGELGPSGTKSLAGLYASVNPENISFVKSDNSTIYYQRVANKSNNGNCNSSSTVRADRVVKYPLYLVDPTTNVYTNYDLPAGSVIRFDFQIWRSAYGGLGAGSDSESINWRWEQEFTTSEAYTSFYDWWDQNNIGSLVNGTSNTGARSITGDFDNTSYSVPTDMPDPQCYKFRFAFSDQVDGTGATIQFANLILGHDVPRGGPGIDKRPSHVNMRIFVNRQNDLLVFETIPDVADPNIFFDSSELYSIGRDSNNELCHNGNVQNQNIQSQTPAIINLPFFNCFAFGNGVESYQILDLAVEKRLNLGERSLGETNTEIKRADRFMGLTYSGIFSGQNNLNNLNEFNLGLVNFKDLEISFGPIMKLHSRETDMLVLQEDRISYVLLGKNLLSDAVGGGAVSSVPEVLGTQIARIEEYGISFNPESFTSWGSDMYFTDSKRSAIIKLSGGTIKSDQLEVVSDYGMRSYFRDQFADQLTTQKIGGYDPYMDEYVLSSNNNPVPVQEEILSCGNIVTILDSSVPFARTFNLGAVTQNVEVDITFPNTTSEVNIMATWNGTTVISASNVSTNQTYTFAKTLAYPQELNVLISPVVDSSFDLVVNCPKQFTGKVVRVVLSSNADSGKTVHNQYQWYKTVPTEPTYFSPLDINAVKLGNTTNSESLTFFDLKEGIQSLDMIPYNTTKIVLGSRTFGSDDITFDPTLNNFYVRVLPPTTTLNTAADWSLSLIAPTAPATPVLNPSTGLFTVEQTLGSYTQSPTATPTLLLVTDLRRHYKASFGYSASSSTDACGVNQPCHYFSSNSVPVATAAQAAALDPNNLPSGQVMTGRGHKGATVGLPRVGDPCYATASCGQVADMPPGFYRLATTQVRVIEIGSGQLAGICINKLTF